MFPYNLLQNKCDTSIFRSNSSKPNNKSDSEISCVDDFEKLIKSDNSNQVQKLHLIKISNIEEILQLLLEVDTSQKFKNLKEIVFYYCEIHKDRINSIKNFAENNNLKIRIFTINPIDSINIKPTKNFEIFNPQECKISCYEINNQLTKKSLLESNYNSLYLQALKDFSMSSILNSIMNNKKFMKVSNFTGKISLTIKLEQCFLDKHNLDSLASFNEDLRTRNIDVDMEFINCEKDSIFSNYAKQYNWKLVHYESSVSNQQEDPLQTMSEIFSSFLGAGGPMDQMSSKPKQRKSRAFDSINQTFERQINSRKDEKFIKQITEVYNKWRENGNNENTRGVKNMLEKKLKCIMRLNEFGRISEQTSSGETIYRFEENTKNKDITTMREEMLSILDYMMIGQHALKKSIVNVFLNARKTGVFDRPILLIGQPGVGKSHIIKACGALACYLEYGDVELAILSGHMFSYIIDATGLSDAASLEGTSESYVNAKYGEMAEAFAHSMEYDLQFQKNQELLVMDGLKQREKIQKKSKLDFAEYLAKKKIKMHPNRMISVIGIDEADKSINRINGGSALNSLLTPLGELGESSNKKFKDHFLGDGFELDLSKVLVILTSNDINAKGLSGPLLDRCEKITLVGYSDTEKQDIVKDAIEKQINSNNLAGQIYVPQETIISLVENSDANIGLRAVLSDGRKMINNAILELKTKIEKDKKININTTQKITMTIQEKDLARLLEKPFYGKNKKENKSSHSVEFVSNDDSDNLKMFTIQCSEYDMNLYHGGNKFSISVEYGRSQEQHKSLTNDLNHTLLCASKNIGGKLISLTNRIKKANIYFEVTPHGHAAKFKDINVIALHAIIAFFARMGGCVIPKNHFFIGGCDINGQFILGKEITSDNILERIKMIMNELPLTNQKNQEIKIFLPSEFEPSMSAVAEKLRGNYDEKKRTIIITNKKGNSTTRTVTIEIRDRISELLDYIADSNNDSTVAKNLL